MAANATHHGHGRHPLIGVQAIPAIRAGALLREGVQQRLFRFRRLRAIRLQAGAQERGQAIGVGLQERQGLRAGVMLQAPRLGKAHDVRLPLGHLGDLSLVVTVVLDVHGDHARDAAPADCLAGQHQGLHHAR